MACNGLALRSPMDAEANSPRISSGLNWAGSVPLYSAMVGCLAVQPCAARRLCPRAAARTAVLSLVLAMLALAAPGLLAQYSTSKYLDPNSFPADARPGFYFGMPMATDGAYTAISTTDAVWATPVAGNTPLQLFAVGTNLPSSATPATYIYGAVAVSDGMVVFHAAGGGGADPVIQGIYSVAADGSSRAVRVADSTQVANWAQTSDFKNSEYGLFAVASGTVVFTNAQGSIFSAGTDGFNLTNLWQTTSSFAGCGSNDGGAVWSASNPATDGAHHAYIASNGFDRSHLYAAPPTTRDGCVAPIARDCDLCAATDSLPGQPSPGAGARFGEILQIDDGFVYFYASSSSGMHESHGYYGIFKVPLGGGAASAVVTNLSQLPLLQAGAATYDEPYFNGFAVKNGRLVFYAGDNTPGGTGKAAFYLVQGPSFVPVFTNQTSVNNECTRNMEASHEAGLNQTALSPDGLLYFTAESTGAGPDRNGSCDTASLRSNPPAYYVVDSTHPLIPAQTTVSAAESPAGGTDGTPLILNISVGAAAGAGNPKSLVPGGAVTVYFTSPQMDGVQQPAQATLDGSGKATISLGELNPAQRTFTVAYGGDSNFTQSGSNAIALDSRKTPTIKWPEPGAIGYGTALSYSQLDASVSPGNLSGTLVYTPTYGAVLPIGSYELSATFTPTDITDYQPVTKTVRLLVGAPVGITPAPGSVLPGPIVTFNGGTSLWLGTYEGGRDLYDSGVNTPKMAWGLPTGNVIIYARVFSGTYYSDYTYMGATPGKVTSPAPGSVLSGPTATFSWSTVPWGITYVLHVTSSSGVDLFDGAGSGNSATVYGLPTDGTQISATLVTAYHGHPGPAGASFTTNYTAATLPEPTLTAPAPGTVLTSPRVTFNWTTGTGASAYSLWVGTTGVGSKSLFDSGETTATSATTNVLPANGEPVYVRLFASYNGVARHFDYSYTAPTAGILTSPVPGSGLPGATSTFTWTAGNGTANGYSLWLGTTGAGSKNLYDSGEIAATSVEVGGLPTNGETVYARLFTSFNGLVVHEDYTYLTRMPTTISWSEPAPISYGTGLSAAQLDATASSGGNLVPGTFVYSPDTGTVLPVGMNTLSATFTPAAINNYQPATATVRLRVIEASAVLTTPTPGGALPGFSATFGWSSVTGATGYSLWLGSTGVGSKNLFDSGESALTSLTVNGLPHNGERIYARLYTNFSGIAVFADYAYTAAPTAVLTAPTPGSLLTGPGATFAWSSVIGASGYSLWLGTTGVGSKNLYDSGQTAGASLAVGGLPLNGKTIYARLYTIFNGIAVPADFTYTAAAAAMLTMPVPGSVLAGPEVTFVWGSVPGASGYSLWLGSTGVGSNNLYDSGEWPATSFKVGSLPMNGETIYARLYTRLDGVTAFVDSTFTAAQPGILTTPTPGSVLTGASVTFSWTPSTGTPTGYSLWVGSTGVGSNNLFDSRLEPVNSRIVNGLPTGGETIYVRLYTNFHGVVIWSDSTYTAAGTATADQRQIHTP